MVVCMHVRVLAYLKISTRISIIYPQPPSAPPLQPIQLASQDSCAATQRPASAAPPHHEPESHQGRDEGQVWWEDEGRDEGQQEVQAHRLEGAEGCGPVGPA